MKVYTVIEMADVELLSVNSFQWLEDAQIHFDACAKENDSSVFEVGDLAREISGTLALAGDDSYSVQLVEGTLK